MGNKHTTSMK